MQKLPVLGGYSIAAESQRELVGIRYWLVLKTLQMTQSGWESRT